MRWAYETLGKLRGMDKRSTHRKGWFRLQERHDTYLAMQELSADT